MSAEGDLKNALVKEKRRDEKFEKKPVELSSISRKRIMRAENTPEQMIITKETEEQIHRLFPDKTDQELADAMGADVSCSRPIVDAKWMEKSRQVGTSGQTVKPKVYMACGISGSFQHLGGIKGNPFMVAINKNIKAPIFQVADIGIEADILDFLPELTEKINE